MPLRADLFADGLSTSKRLPKEPLRYLFKLRFAIRSGMAGVGSRAADAVSMG